MRKITCWYRIVNGERKYNHFTYGWTNRTSPFPFHRKQEQEWKGVEWDRVYGYLVNGVVKEFPCGRTDCDKNHEAKECKYFKLW